MSLTSGIVGGLAGAGIGAVFGAAGRWVADGAVWLLDQVGHAMSATTTVPLDTRWFAEHQAVMVSLAGAVVLPMLCCTVLQAVLRQDAGMVLRAVMVQLPLAMLLTGVVVVLVRLGLALTDALSARVLAGAGADSGNVLAPLVSFLSATGLGDPTVPGFVLFLGGLLAAVAALTLWLELVVRSAAVSAAVLFLPLALAALVWPAVSHWCRRLADTLVALLLSKLVVAAVLSLAAGAVAGGSGASGPGGGGFAGVVTGLALLFIATVSPFTLLRLVPAIEGGAVAHLESTRHRMRQAAHAPVRAAGVILGSVSGGPGGALAAAAGPIGEMGRSSVGAVVGNPQSTAAAAQAVGGAGGHASTGTDAAPSGPSGTEGLLPGGDLGTQATRILDQVSGGADSSGDSSGVSSGDGTRGGQAS